MTMSDAKPLELERDDGGWRHFLDGRPVETGAHLELQPVEFLDDDTGGHLQPVPGRWVTVRYEARLAVSDRADVRVSLYSTIGGYQVELVADEGMRFRWP